MTKKIKTEPCPRCKGAGYVCSAAGRPGCWCSAPEKCTLCQGSGRVPMQGGGR